MLPRIHPASSVACGVWPEALLYLCKAIGLVQSRGCGISITARGDETATLRGDYARKAVDTLVF